MDRSLSILSAQAKHIIIERNRLFCPPLINLKWSNGVRFYIQDSRGNKIRRDQTDVSCLVWGCPWCAEYFLHKLHSTQSLIFSYLSLNLNIVLLKITEAQRKMQWVDFTFVNFSGCFLVTAVCWIEFLWSVWLFTQSLDRYK